MTEQVTLAKPARKPAVKKAADEKPVSTPFKSLSDIRLGMIVRDPASGLTGVVNMKAIRIAESLCFITFLLFIAWTIRTLEIRIVYFEYNILVKSPFPHTACTIYCG